MNNPFNPGFGKLPEIYLGREEDVSKFTRHAGEKNNPYQTTLVYGMRGTGKTAFLTDLDREFHTRKNWIVVDLVLGTSSSLLKVLVDEIYTKTQSWISKILEGISGVHLSGLGITFDINGNDESHQYQVVLEKVLEELKKRDIWVLITIDEVKNTQELREFAAVYQLLIRNEYNLCLVMAGLPENVSSLQNDSVLTFLLRAGRIVLKPIDLWLVRNSYAQVFEGNRKISDQMLNQITGMTKGYAYAFQLLGYDLWEESETAVTEEVVRKADRSYRTDLYRNSYVKIWQGLTGAERDFLLAMAKTGQDQVRFGDIVAGMKKPKNYVSTYRLRLLDTQVIDAPAHGYVRFTLPYFREFILDSLDLFM